MRADFSELVSAIYDCALAPPLWPAALAKVRDALRAEYVALRTMGLSPQIPSTTVSSPWRDDALRVLRERYASNMPGREGGLSLDRPIATLQRMDELAFRDTPFFREWVAPNGLRDGCTTLFSASPDAAAYVSFGTSQQREPVTLAETELIAQLAPHLRRAVAISDTIRRAACELADLRQTLSNFEAPILICDAAGGLRFANVAAQALLQDGQALAMVDGIVTPGAPAMRQAFADALARAGEGDSLLGRRGVGLPLASAPHVRCAYVLPLGVTEIRHGAGAARVAIFVSTGAGRAAPDEAVLMTLYDLKPIEARLMADIGAGRTPQEVGAALGLSEIDVNTHLAAVYEKTGVNRLASLAKLYGELGLPLAVSSAFIGGSA